MTNPITNYQNSLLDTFADPALTLEEAQKGRLIGSVVSPTSQAINTAKADLFFKMTIAEQLDFLSSGHMVTQQFGPGQTSVMMQYLPMNFWTSAYTTAASALTDEANGLKAKTKRMAIMGQILNFPYVLDDTFTNVWNALTTGCTNGEKIDLLSFRLTTATSSALSNNTIGHSRLASDIGGLINTLAGTALTKDERLALWRLVSSNTTANDPLWTAVMRNSNFIANLCAFDTVAKQCFHEALSAGIISTGSVPLLFQSLKVNSAAFTALKAKGVEVTKAANSTAAAITGLTGTKFVLLAASCPTTAAGLSLYVRGYVYNANYERVNTTVTFSYKPASLPALTTTALDARGETITMTPFVSPEFAHNNASTETLSMVWLNCD